MYELERKEVVREQLKLGDEVLEITIVPDNIARSYNEAVAQLFKARKSVAQAKDDPALVDEALAMYGAALTRIMEVLLGTENTQKIVAFYEGQIIEMGAQVTPYLADELIPKVKQAAKAIRLRKWKTYRKEARRARRLFRR